MLDGRPDLAREVALGADEAAEPSIAVIPGANGITRASFRAGNASELHGLDLQRRCEHPPGDVGWPGLIHCSSTTRSCALGISNFGTGDPRPAVSLQSSHPPAVAAPVCQSLRPDRLWINLRGATGTGSYHLSRDAAWKLGPRLPRPVRVREPWRAAPRPHPAPARHLSRHARRGARPSCFHCKSGADRAGLAAGLCILCLEGGSATGRRWQATLLAPWPHQTGLAPAFWMPSSCAISA